MHHSRNRCARAPNDPKLSDRGARRGTCTVGGKAAVEAGAVTCGAVRCSAWLGARLDSVETWRKSLGTVELAGDSRMTGNRKVELGESMELPETKRLAVSRRVAGRNAKLWLRLRAERTARGRRGTRQRGEMRSAEHS